MAFKALLVFLSMIASGMLFIISIALMIMKWKNEKLRITWMIIGAVSFTTAIGLLFFGVFSLMKKGFEKAEQQRKELSYTMEETGEELARAALDNRTFLLDTLHPNTQTAILKSYEPEQMKGKVPPAFYTYFGFRDSYRFPLVYPYSINCIDVTDHGYLSDERNAKDILYDTEGVRDLNINDITALTFDRNLLLAEINGNDMGNVTPHQYLLFYFDGTKGPEYFQTQKELMERAGKLNFTGNKNMMTLHEYNGLFLSY